MVSCLFPSIVHVFSLSIRHPFCDLTVIVCKVTDVRKPVAATLKSLFDAQRHHKNASPGVLPTTITPVQQSHQSHLASDVYPPQKSTLHAFWQLPRQQHEQQHHRQDIRPGGIATAGRDNRTQMSCQDCDAILLSASPSLSSSISSDAMDIDETFLEQETACTVCGRNVCNLCAVVMDRRVCLGCVALR